MILDTLMLVIMLILFNKLIFGMAFHEIAGLALLVVFLFHKLVNFKWIKGVTPRVFSKGLPTKARIQFLVDFLMLLCFVLIGVSGVMISKVVFFFQNHAMIWKTLHYFCAALVLILIGIHLGLHIPFFQTVFHGFTQMSRLAGILLTIITAAVCVFGIYSMSSSNFSRWVSMPFQNSPAGGQRMGEAKGMEQKQAQTVAVDDNADQPTAPQNGKGPMAGHGQASSGIGDKLLSFVRYFSIVFLFAVLTALADRVTRRKPVGA